MSVLTGVYAAWLLSGVSWLVGWLPGVMLAGVMLTGVTALSEMLTEVGVLAGLLAAVSWLVAPVLAAGLAVLGVRLEMKAGGS